MNTITSYLSKRFSRSADSYDDYSDIHRDIAAHLVHITTLPDIEGPVLEIGAGTGILTSCLRNYYCRDQICCLDISDNMLKKIISKDLTDNCIQADFNNLPFPPVFAFVLSSTALHWANNTYDIIQVLKNSVKTGGIFSIALMTDNTYGLLRSIKSELGIPPNTATLPEYFQFLAELEQAGFTVQHAEKKVFIDTFTSIEEVFTSIQQLGVSGLSRSPISGGTLRKLRNRYLSACMETRKTPFLEYETGFFSGIRLI
jgi:malonyl-CoA O-methyltransferase